jgi:hypothetical protein
MRRKLLQNTLFVAMAAWAMYLAQAQPDAPMDSQVAMSYQAQP